jgi:hypothetical protein
LFWDLAKWVKPQQVGTGGIPYDEFLKINPKALF